MRHVMLVLILLACPALNCDGARDTLKDGLNTVLDCTKGELAPAVNDLAPIAEKIVLDALDPAGKVNWAPVKEYGKGLVTNVAKCVLAEGVARVLAPKPDDPNAPKVGGVHVDVAAVRVGFAEVKAELFGPVTFETSAGRL